MNDESNGCAMNCLCCLISIFILAVSAAAGHALAQDTGTVKLDQPGKVYLEIAISGSGKGKVQVSPVEAVCRTSDSVCSYGFIPGTVVRLKAEATGLGNSFDGWIGNCERGETADKKVCRLTMDADKKISAVFSPTAGLTLPLP